MQALLVSLSNLFSIVQSFTSEDNTRPRSSREPADTDVFPVVASPAPSPGWRETTTGNALLATLRHSNLGPVSRQSRYIFGHAILFYVS